MPVDLAIFYYDLNITSFKDSSIFLGGGSVMVRVRNRTVAVLIAFGVACWVPIVAMAYNIYTDPMPVKTVLLIGAGIGALMTVAALLGGLIVRIPVIYDRWKRNIGWAFGIALVCAAVLLGGETLGLTDTFTHGSGNTASGLRLDVALACYYGLIFALANWPAMRRHKSKPQGLKKPQSSEPAIPAPGKATTAA